MSTLFSHFFQKINQIAPLEHDFTEVLDTIAVTPKMLYFYGNLPQNVSKMPKSGSSGPAPNASQTPISDAPKSALVTPKSATVRPPAVAIVGSRHNTRYGQEVAYELAYKLAAKGVIVVSGLAYGIDGIAHQGCLAAGGTTIGVLGTPIDHIYPKSHEGLASEILKQGGAIISEYAPRTAAYAHAPLAPGEAGWDGHDWVNPLSVAAREHPELLNQPFTKRKIDFHFSFLYRNRLIAGLSDIVVVVEAAQKSGSLNTAAHALEQGKDVFAVPGNITSPYSQGCNNLIKAGANPCTSPDDILRLLFPEDYLKKATKKPIPAGSTPVEAAILEALASGLRDGEQIAAALHLSPDMFTQAITMLEIKALVRPLGANHWSLA